MRPESGQVSPRSYSYMNPPPGGHCLHENQFRAMVTGAIQAKVPASGPSGGATIGSTRTDGEVAPRPSRL